MKPKPAPGMNEQWTVDEEEIFAATRRQFALTQREVRLRLWTKWLAIFTLGMLLSTVVRWGADALLPQSALFVQTVAVLVVAAVSLVTSRFASRADEQKLTNVALATKNIKYVPPEADENTAE